MSYASYKNLGKDANAPPPESIINLHHVTSEEDRQKIISNTTFVIIYNYTDWCGPCKQIAPQIAMIAQKYQKDCLIIKEDVDKQFEGAPEIRGVPCFHFYVNGKYFKELTIIGGDVKLVEDTLKQVVDKLNTHQ